MTDRELEQVEETIEISKKEADFFIEKANKLEALISNPLFDELVTVGYFQDNAVRTVRLLADSAMQDNENQEGLMKDLHAISSMQRYFRDIIIQGKQMKHKVDSYEKELEEMRAEQAQLTVAGE